MMTLNLMMCHCGCGRSATLKSGWIRGHWNRGIQRTDEQRARYSESKKGKTWNLGLTKDNDPRIARHSSWLSTLQHERWMEDPSHVLKLRAGSIKAWNDPERRQMRIERISSGIVEALSNDDVRKRMSEGSKKAWSTPERKALRSRITRSNWRDQEFRLRHSGKNHWAWKGGRFGARSEILRERMSYRVSLCRCLALFATPREDEVSDAMGYTAVELVGHIMSQFKPGMSWKNYGSEWEIDHVKPISVWGRHAAVHEVNALSNLQPLWVTENRSKGAKWIEKQA